MQEATHPSGTVASLCELAVRQLQSQHELPRSQQRSPDQQLAQQELRAAVAAAGDHSAFSAICGAAVDRNEFAQDNLHASTPKQIIAQDNLHASTPGQISEPLAFIRPRPRRADNGLRRCRCGDGLPRRMRAGYFHHRDDCEGCMRLHAPPPSPSPPSPPLAPDPVPHLAATIPPAARVAPPTTPPSSQRSWFQRATDAVGAWMRGLPPLRGGRIWVPWGSSQPSAGRPLPWARSGGRGGG